MITISLCMIVKNEETYIGPCLESLKDAVDEIVIVDTGSTDKTRKIVEKFTDRIYEFEWIDDFAAARNYSFAQATMDYILWVDADDVLLKEDANKLIELKKTLDPTVDCVKFNYHYAFDHQGNPSLVFKRERLVKREKHYQWMGFIHEFIAVEGKSIDAEINVTHTRVHGNADRNLNLYRRKLEEGVPFNTRDQYYYGKELYYHGMNEEAIQVLEKFVSQPVWVEDQLDALYRIAECYQNKGERKKARETLYQCFELLPPRAELLFRIGKTFQDEEKFQEAIFWYESIFRIKKPTDTPGFIFEEFWTWKPHLELCVCYFRVGNMEQSYYHNEEAAKYIPEDGAVAYNRSFFKSIKKDIT